MPRPSGTVHTPSRASRSAPTPLTTGRRAAVRPTVSGTEPGSTPERGALAAAVGPEQRDHRARPARRGRRRGAPRSARSRLDVHAARGAALRPRRSGGSRCVGHAAPSRRRRDRRRSRAGRCGSASAVPTAMHAAVVEHVDRVAHAHHQAHVVLDEADGQPVRRPAAAAARRTRASPARSGPDAGSSSRTTDGAGHQGPGQLDDPGPAGRDVGDVLVGHIPQAGQLEDAVGLRRSR